MNVVLAEMPALDELALTPIRQVGVRSIVRNVAFMVV